MVYKHKQPYKNLAEIKKKVKNDDLNEELSVQRGSKQVYKSAQRFNRFRYVTTRPAYSVRG